MRLEEAIGPEKLSEPSEEELVGFVPLESRIARRKLLVSLEAPSTTGEALVIVTFPVPESNVASVTPLAAFTFVRTALRDSPLSIVTMVPLTVKLPPTSVLPRG